MLQLAVAYYPEEYPLLNRCSPLRVGLRPLVYASHFKRNPRDEDSMRSLAEQGFSIGSVVHAGDLDASQLKTADEILLLWPDGNGYGWFNIELKAFRLKGKNSVVTVINGRKRRFELTRNVWLGYLIRRTLERFWIGEVVFSFAFFLVTPLLVLWDALRGRT